jgi:hypothetical protein
MTEINLLPDKSRLDFQKFKLASRAREIAFAFLGVFLVLTAIVFIAKFFVNFRLNQANKHLLEAKQEFSNYLPVVDEQQKLRLKVKTVASILEKRAMPGKKLSHTSELIGDDISIFKAVIDTKTARYELKTGSLQAVKTLEGKLEEEKLNNEYDEFYVSNLVKGQDNAWTFNLFFDY